MMAKSDWTFSRVIPGEYEAHDGERVRAKIIRRRPRMWIAHRMRLQRDGTIELQSGDIFHTLAEAKDFCCNRPGIWGR
jgi:hypothetical protein